MTTTASSTTHNHFMAILLCRSAVWRSQLSSGGFGWSSFTACMVLLTATVAHSDKENGVPV